MKTKVDERMWWAVKTLLKGGSTIVDAAEYLMLSENTVSRIKQSETYEDYKQIIAAMHAPYRKPKRTRLPDKKGEPQQEEPKEEKQEAKQADSPKPVEPQVIEHRQTVTVQATHYMMTELQKTNEYLKTISAKLAFIVDELCGTKGA